MPKKIDDQGQPPVVQYYDRDPYPQVQNGSIAAGVTDTLEYTNAIEESSEIQAVVIRAPPLCTVTVTRTDDNIDQTVYDSVRIQDMDRDNAGNPILRFREVERDKPLKIRKNQTYKVKITNNYAFIVNYRSRVIKNQLRYYSDLESVKEAAGR